MTMPNRTVLEGSAMLSYAIDPHSRRSPGEALAAWAVVATFLVFLALG